MPAHGRLIVDRSTTRRVTPARLHVLTILNDARDRRVALGERQHLFAPFAIVLRVVVEKRHPFGVVILACLLTVRTSRLRVDD
jgi:hypothetical protein